jgi:uncharacterized protein YicC (UPF0701 family)
VSNSILSQIENSFSQLSISEQLRLIERLVHHVHDATMNNKQNLDQQLALMATDPEIQNELQRIEQEFSQAEADGLETA